MSSMAAAEAGEASMTSFRGIGNVSGEVLLSSVVPGLASHNIAGKQQSSVCDNKTRKKRLRKSNASSAAMDASYQSAAIDASFQSVVIDTGLHSILDISRISFKPPSADDQRTGCNDLAGLGDTWLTRWPLGGASVDEELTSSSFRQGRTRRKKDIVRDRVDTDLSQGLVIT